MNNEHEELPVSTEVERWQLCLPDKYSPHSVEVRIPLSKGNWTVRCTERKSGAKRGESPVWYGWDGELRTAKLISLVPELTEVLRDAVRDLRNTYDACKSGWPTISLGQFRRLSAAEDLLAKLDQ